MNHKKSNNITLSTNLHLTNFAIHNNNQKEKHKIWIKAEALKSINIKYGLKMNNNYAVHIH